MIVVFENIELVRFVSWRSHFVHNVETGWRTLLSSSAAVCCGTQLQKFQWRGYGRGHRVLAGCLLFVQNLIIILATGNLCCTVVYTFFRVYASSSSFSVKLLILYLVSKCTTFAFICKEFPWRFEYQPQICSCKLIIIPDESLVSDEDSGKFPLTFATVVLGIYVFF